MKRLSIIFSLMIYALISYGQPIPIPGVKPTSFPLKAVLDGSEELYTQRDINGINNRRFLVSQVADYIRLLNPHDSIIVKGDSICIKGSNCIYLGTALNFVDSLRISNDTLYYHKGSTWRPLVLPSSTDSIFYTGNDTLPLYTVLTTGNAAPGSPAVGATYWVGASPTGSWAGHAQDIATWTGSAWTFHDAVNGDYMYNANTGYTYQWRSPKWVQVSGIPILNNGNSLSTGVRIGTNNATPLNFETGNTIKMVIQAGGAVKINNLSSNTYPLVGTQNDGTLRKIYLSSDFNIDIDTLRYTGPTGGGTFDSTIAGNGLSEVSNTINLGGRLTKASTVITNATDTMFRIDSTGFIWAPKLPYLNLADPGGITIISPSRMVVDTLIDSVLHNIYSLNDTFFCHSPDTAGVRAKVFAKDGNKLIVDTTQFGSCTGTEAFTMVQFKFPKPVFSEPQTYVDSFLVYFGGYDTLNVGGNTYSEGNPYYSLSMGHKILYQHFGQGSDSVIKTMGDPYDIGYDTIGIIGVHFDRPLFDYEIDSIVLTILVPQKGNTDFKIYFDAIAIVFPFKPMLKDVKWWGGRLLITDPVTNSGPSITSGNGVQINSGVAQLGPLTQSAVLNGNNHEYQMTDLSSYTISSNGSASLNGANVQITSQTGAISLIAGNGRDLELTAGNGSGGAIVLNTNSGDGIFVSGASQDDAIPYLLGSTTTDGTQNLRWRSAASLLGGVTPTIFSVNAGTGLTKDNDSTLSLGGVFNNEVSLNGNNNYGLSLQNLTNYSVSSNGPRIYNYFGQDTSTGNSMSSSWQFGHPLLGQASYIRSTPSGIYLEHVRSTAPGFGSGNSNLLLEDTLAILTAGADLAGATVLLKPNRAMIYNIPETGDGTDCAKILGRQTANNEIKWIDNPINSGLYLPTATSVSNCTMGIIDSSLYTRVGNIVTVYGTLRFTTVIPVSISFILDVPIASTCTDTYQLSGTGGTISGGTCMIWGNTGGMAAQFNMTLSGVETNSFLRYSFQYQVR